MSVSGARRSLVCVASSSATEQTAQLFAHLSCPSTCTDAADAARAVNAAIIPHASSYAGHPFTDCKSAVSEGTTHYHSPPLISVMPSSQLKFDTCHVLTDSRRPGYLQHNERGGAASRLGKVISRDLEMPGQHDMCAQCADR